MRLLHPFIAVAALALGGCSALLDFDCANESDCGNLEGDYVCQNGTCIERPTPEVCGGEALINTLCTELYGPEGATTEDRAAAYLADPEGFALLGVHVPTGGFAGQAEDSIKAVVELAVEDVKAGGQFQGLSTKKFATLICDDGASALDNGVAAGLHAVECGAKMLIGTHEDAPTLRLYDDVAKVRGVPLLSPGAISPEVGEARSGLREEEKDLLWRIKVPGDVVAEATGAMVRDLGQHQNVVVLGRLGDPYSEGLEEALRDGMCSNTLFCQESTIETHFYDGLDTVAQDSVAEFLSPGGAAKDIDLIITVAPNLDDLLQVLLAVSDWVELRGEDPKADIITVEGARSSLGLLAYASTATATWPEVACRTIGISSGSIGPARDTWNSKIGIANSARPDDPIEIFSPTPPYADATIIAGLAMASSMAQFNGEVTTDGIITGLKRMAEPDDGAPQASVNEWATGRDLAGTFEPTPLRFDFIGASGEVDFELTTRDVADRTVEVWAYDIGDGNLAGFGVRNVDGSLTDRDGVVDLAQLQAAELQRADDPQCADYPYRFLVPNPPAE